MAQSGTSSPSETPPSSGRGSGSTAADLLRYRAVLIIGGAAYVIWGYLLHALNPEAVDPLVARYIVFGACVALAALTYLSRHFSKSIHAYSIVLVWAVTIHYFVLMRVNDLARPYLVCAFIVLYATLQFINSRAAWISYSTMVISVASILFWSSDNPYKVLFLYGLLTMVLLSFTAMEWQRMTLASLHEGEERLRDLANASFEAIVISEEGQVTDVNNAFTRTLGYTRESVLDHPVLEIVAESAREMVREKLQSTREETYESIVRHKDGHEIRVEVRGKSFYRNGRLARFAALRDVTMSRRAAERLSKVNACFLAFGPEPELNIRQLTGLCGDVVAARGAMYLRDMGGRQVTVSSWRAAASPQLPEPPVATLWSAGDAVTTRFDDLTWTSHPVRCRAKTVGLICVASDSPLAADDARLLGIIASAIGVEEDRSRTAQIIIEQQYHIVSSSKMSALGEMASGIAHEINNPLTIIHGKAEQLRMLADSPNPDPEFIRKAADKIESTSMRIAKIVKSLRSFAREGENDPFQTAQLKTIIDETLELCTERFRNHTIEIRRGEVPPSLELECRPSQISQVLLNLLNNAFDAATSLEEKWIKIDVNDLGDRLELSVTDSGKGVSREIYDKIFNPFFTTKAVGKGTGLGLSISRGIVEAHRGSLKLDPMSRNTCFVVTLPKRQPGAAAANPLSEAA